MGMPVIVKRLLGAVFLALAVSTTATAEDQPPIFYPMPAIAIQYETKNCGFKTMMISTQLEYMDNTKTDRITAFLPKIMSIVYADLKKHLVKDQTMSDHQVKTTVLNVVNRVVGRDSVQDVLIMNVVNG